MQTVMPTLTAACLGISITYSLNNSEHHQRWLHLSTSTIAWHLLKTSEIALSCVAQISRIKITLTIDSAGLGFHRCQLPGHQVFRIHLRVFVLGAALKQGTAALPTSVHSQQWGCQVGAWCCRGGSGRKTSKSEATWRQGVAWRGQ